MRNPSGQDETTPIDDNILLIAQKGWLAGPGGSPPGVSVNGTERQFAAGILEISYFLMLYPVLVDSRLRQ